MEAICCVFFFMLCLFVHLYVSGANNDGVSSLDSAFSFTAIFSKQQFSLQSSVDNNLMKSNITGR